MIDIREHGGNYGSGSGGASSKMNVFCQPKEPKDKEGIWIQSSNKHFVKEIVIDDSPYTSDSWIKDVPNMITKRSDFSSVVVNNKIYCICGRDFNNSILYSEVYDINNKTWSNIANIPYGRGSFGCTTVGNDIYVIGGTRDYKAPDILIYNIDTNTWREGPTMPYRKMAFGCVSIDHKIYCIGGIKSQNSNTQLETSVYILDTINNSWSEGKTMPFPQSPSGCAAIGNKIYCMCGSITNIEDPNVSNYIDRSNIVQIYDTLTNTWTQGKRCGQGKNSFGCATVGNDIYCIGGMFGMQLDNSVEIYNTSTDSWRFGPSCIESKTSSSAVFANDRIYDIGGTIYSSAVASIDILSFKSKQYKNGQIVLEKHNNNIGKYFTQLINISTKRFGPYSRITSTFDNAWLFEDNDLKPYPTYYGDGEKWIKFKG